MHIVKICNKNINQFIFQFNVRSNFPKRNEISTEHMMTLRTDGFTSKMVLQQTASTRVLTMK